MATKSNTEMSEWIKFFTAAGIPPGPAAKYAMTFLDNRINKTMLMDLTKEYLKEMGIVIMGDVICILKHAKSAYSKYERERPILEAMPQPEDGKIELKRQTTPGNRMLEHYMRREGLMEESTKVKITTAMATRLGAVPTMGTKKKLIGVPESVEVIPVKKPRRVPPEEEGAYVISLPKGSTLRTKKILGQKVVDTKSSVFARLGGSSAGSTDTAATAAGGQMVSKGTAAGNAKQISSPTVFNRLGSQTMLSSPTNPVLQYHGVLKSSPKSSPTPKITTIALIPQVKAAAGGVQERLGIQRPEVSTTTLTHMDSFGLKHSLQARLGGQKSDSSAVAPQKMKIIVNNDSTASASKKTSPGVLARLGAQKRSTPPTGKPKQMVTLKPGLTKRLGGQKTPVLVGLKPEAKPRMMARLGQMQNTASSSKATPTRLGKVQKRLGLPVKSTETPKASLKERLGLQKAEASSTTPTFTVTLGGTSGTKKLTGSTRKRKRKSAGSVPEESAMRSVSMGQDVFSRLGSG